jgi:hypothetical protein
LTSTLERREPAVASENSEHLEGALRTLSERIDRMPVATDNASAFAHLEQRVSYLLERLESSTDHRAGNLGRVEDGLQDILRHLESQHESFATLAENSRVWAENRRHRSPRSPTPGSPIPVLPISSSANCPTSASARPRPAAPPRIRWKPSTIRWAMSSIASQ